MPSKHNTNHTTTNALPSPQSIRVRVLFGSPLFTCHSTTLYHRCHVGRRVLHNYINPSRFTHASHPPHHVDPNAKHKARIRRRRCHRRPNLPELWRVLVTVGDRDLMEKRQPAQPRATALWPPPPPPLSHHLHARLAKLL